VLGGIYNLDGEDGHFTGSRDNQNTDPIPATDFDGSYEIRILRDEIERIADVLMVTDGRFDMNLNTIDEQAIHSAGYITGALD
jgi:hypothetical protein